VDSPLLESRREELTDEQRLIVSTVDQLMQKFSEKY
jgi:hypothetical protein